MHSMLFEDSLHPKKVINKEYCLDEDKYITISLMLKRYLSSREIEVYFSNSAGNILDYLTGFKNNRVIVYYDLVYDNRDTIKYLTDILNTIASLGLSNVAIVPIHCIEWHCIKCFGTECELKDIVLRCEDYKDTDTYKYNVRKRNSSHERFCKAAMSILVDKKFLGSCSIEEYKISEEEERMLAYSLPIFFSEDSGLYKVNAKEFLESYYKGFIDKFVSPEDETEPFKEALARYLRILEF